MIKAISTLTCCLGMVAAMAQNKPLFELLPPAQTGVQFQNTIVENNENGTNIGRRRVLQVIGVGITAVAGTSLLDGCSKPSAPAATSNCSFKSQPSGAGWCTSSNPARGA